MNFTAYNRLSVLSLLGFLFIWDSYAITDGLVLKRLNKQNSAHAETTQLVSCSGPFEVYHYIILVSILVLATIRIA